MIRGRPRTGIFNKEFIKIPSIIYKRIKTTNLMAIELAIKSEIEKRRQAKSVRI